MEYTIEDKLNFIIELFERHNNTKFIKQVALSGFINAPKYSLVVRDKNDAFKSFRGAETFDILKINESFVNEYLERLNNISEKLLRPDNKLYNWDKDFINNFRVVKSESELKLKMDMELLK